MGGHGLGNLTPTRKRVTFLHRFCLRHDCSTELNLIRLVLSTIHHISQLVPVDRECPCDCHVMRWHGLGNPAPTRECIPFFNRFCLWSDCCAVLHFHRFILSTVHHISQFVLVDRKRTCNGYVIRWHSSWYPTPA